MTQGLAAGPTEAAVISAVRVWIDPTRSEEVLSWLDGGHLAEVAALPGFLWVRRYRLAQDADDGWQAHFVVYGLKDQASFDAFVVNPVRQRFSRERAHLEDAMRLERFSGTLGYEAVTGG